MSEGRNTRIILLLATAGAVAVAIVGIVDLADISRAARQIDQIDLIDIDVSAGAGLWLTVIGAVVAAGGSAVGLLLAGEES